jgi:nucleoside-diphosphate-sugar epimerase
MAKILVIGCGDIGGALALQLQEEGHQVTGLRRSPRGHESVINYIKADVTSAANIGTVHFDFDQLVYILSPDTSDISAYELVFKTGVDNVLKALKKSSPNVGITFVSSSRVYGQRHGEWLDESSKTAPTDERGKLLLAAEKSFLAFNQQITIVRFSGIYGRSNYFIKQIKSAKGIQKEPAYYTNRVHRADCIGALAFLINKKSNGKRLDSIYLVSDDDPASKWDIACYLADALSLRRPVALTLAAEAGCNKRLDNRRLIEEGYEFKYKNYKEGYKEVIDEHT